MSAEDDVLQLVAAAHFLRELPLAEAHYYSKVIAEIARRMLAAPVAAPSPAKIALRGIITTVVQSAGPMENQRQLIDDLLAALGAA